MKTPTVKKDNLALLPTEVKEQIVKENCELLFNTEVDMKKRLFVLQQTIIPMDLPTASGRV
jgi:hypothetical protein